MNFGENSETLDIKILKMFEMPPIPNLRPVRQAIHKGFRKREQLTHRQTPHKQNELREMFSSPNQTTLAVLLA